MFDYGDAPDSYQTFAGSGGAFHALGGPQLGAKIDFDGNGQPSVGADGDDLNFTDDEDGVVLTGLVPGSNGTATVVLTNALTARLDAWMDFNLNGVFDATEQIFVSTPLVAGTNTLSFAIPSNTATTTYARFRVSQPGGLNPAGWGGPGEVEDYQVHMVPGTNPADLNGDGSIDAADAGLMFANWGGSGPGDLNQDGIIDAADAGELFSAWSGDGPSEESHFSTSRMSSPRRAYNA